ncbi:helix-turn-helix transcriptional regulator, partial [Vibrio rotiferianus]
MSVSVHLPALKDIRVAKGFTQEALAAAIHKTTKTISRIENGDPTSIETAKLLAQVLELKSFAQLQS